MESKDVEVKRREYDYWWYRDQYELPFTRIRVTKVRRFIKQGLTNFTCRCGNKFLNTYHYWIRMSGFDPGDPDILVKDQRLACSETCLWKWFEHMYPGCMEMDKKTLCIYFQHYHIDVSREIYLFADYGTAFSDGHYNLRGL